MTDRPTAEPVAVTAADSEWRRLSVRVVWVDLAQTVLSLLPGVIAITVFGQTSAASLWPVAAVAVFGVVGSVADILRWAFTRYRISATEVERMTGIFVRQRRSVRRERIRSVDTHAKLRHRIGGLRVVTIGAGQQTGTGEAALALDALSKTDAERLSRELLDATAPARAALAVDRATATAAAVTPPSEQGDLTPDDAQAATAQTEGAAEAVEPEVLATLRPWWVVYNVFSIWAFVTAAGLLWGLFWLLSTFGIDIVAAVRGAIDWSALGWWGIAAVSLLVTGVIGAIGMGVNFLTGFWRFELARVRAGGRSYLRTRRGLFSTREVNRDEERMRGLTIGEPLLWRWMGMADTNVITTGLNVWDLEEPTAILPRGPIRVARGVAERVLGDPSPLDVPLPRHPGAALRRRLWWATFVAAVPAAALVVPIVSGAIPPWPLWLVLGLWVIALLLAFAAYRALGHAITGDYLVVRSGMLSRSTSALRRDAVSTIAVRQSILQRRLGLSTVSAMTAAGWSAYEAPDVAHSESVAFAAAAAPGLLQEFVVSDTEER